MKGYEVVVRVKDVRDAIDRFEVLAGSHEKAAIEGIRLFRARHPNWDSYELEPPDVEPSDLLTEKLRAMQPITTPLNLPQVEDYTFDDWISSTAALQLSAYHRDPATWLNEQGELTDEGADKVIREGVWAAVAELVEASEEVGWKSWATSRHVHREKFITEIVDAMHFIGNVLRMVKCTGPELTQAYRAKQQRNLERQLEGYDGVSSKCRSCHRDLYEVGTTVVGSDKGRQQEFCGGCGEKVTVRS